MDTIVVELQEQATHKVEAAKEQAAEAVDQAKETAGAVAAAAQETGKIFLEILLHL